MEEERFTWPSNLEGSLLLEDIVLRVMICGVGKDGLHARTGSLYPHLDRSDPGPGMHVANTASAAKLWIREE